mmetsp:Transcript_8918/g.19466  ORF Transcript_8918/g.19466 Transcript_8918/m.19466 type:complete len:353 (-) Transcript_8918:442-1500(-)
MVMSDGTQHIGTGRCFVPRSRRLSVCTVEVQMAQIHIDIDFVVSLRELLKNELGLLHLVPQSQNNANALRGIVGYRTFFLALHDLNVFCQGLGELVLSLLLDRPNLLLLFRAYALAQRGRSVKVHVSKEHAGVGVHSWSQTCAQILQDSDRSLEVPTGLECLRLQDHWVDGCRVQLSSRLEQLHSLLESTVAATLHPKAQLGIDVLRRFVQNVLVGALGSLVIRHVTHLLQTGQVVRQRHQSALGVLDSLGVAPAQRCLQPALRDQVRCSGAVGMTCHQPQRPNVVPDVPAECRLHLARGVAVAHANTSTVLVAGQRALRLPPVLPPLVKGGLDQPQLRVAGFIPAKMHSRH